MVYYLIGVFVALHIILASLVVIRLPPGSNIYFLFVHYDAIIHFMSSLVLIIVGYLILSHYKIKYSQLISTGYMGFLIIAVELIQYNLTYRSSDLRDLTFGFIGLILANIIVLIIKNKKSKN